MKTQSVLFHLGRNNKNGERKVFPLTCEIYDCNVCTNQSLTLYLSNIYKETYWVPYSSESTIKFLYARLEFETYVESSDWIVNVCQIMETHGF